MDELPTCSICLNPVRSTRNSKPLRCGHVFHKHCLDTWSKKPNGHTCPTCRRVWDCSKYTVKFEIINNYTAVSNTQVLNRHQVMNVFDVFELTMNMEEEIDLEALFEDVGIDMGDLEDVFEPETTVASTGPVETSSNAFVSNTESAAIP